MVMFCVTIWRTARLFSKVVAPFTSPPAVYKGSTLFTSFPTLTICLFNITILLGMRYILGDSSLWFLFTFLLWLIMLEIFSCAYCFFFGDRSIQIFVHFKLGYMSFYYWVVRVLYVLWIHVSCEIYELQIFSLILWDSFPPSWQCPLKYRKF